MRTTRVGVTAVGIAALLALGAAPAQAKGPASLLQLRVTPAQPLATEPIHVRFVADGRLPRGWRYSVGVGLGNTLSTTCDGGVTNPVTGLAPRGTVIEFDVRPKLGRWCKGGFTVVVERVNLDGMMKLVARRTILIRPDANYPVLENPVSISLLEGSTLTIRAPGRADVVEGVGGRFRGAISGEPKPNTDTDLRLDSGSFELRSFAPNPSCPGASYATAFAIAPGSFSHLAPSGHVTLKLVLAGDPLALAACGGVPAGATALVLDGQVGAGGLLKMQVVGSVGDLTIGGAPATIVADFLIKVDLSGRD